MTLTTLVTGATAASREAAIASDVTRDLHTALILEGLPSGKSVLEGDLLAELHITHIARIAPGCLCCTGNLTMQVTLNRMLRAKPERLYISLASVEHLANVRKFLSNPPYQALLSLTADLQA